MAAAGLGGAAAGLPVAGLVLVINMAVFGMALVTPGNLTILATTIAVSAIVAMTVQALHPDHASDTPDAPAAAPQPPALLARLTLDKRGPLVSLTATDHYTEVTTTRGRDLILIRLADAIAEAAPTPGLRVHRSHWVARDHIAAVRRRDAGAEVTLSDGRVIPVSRGNLPALREAGLLPR
jgi:DNA-binding LytR/AlgR family response regulator